jgi:lysophospholipase L1-like esterase
MLSLIGQAAGNGHKNKFEGEVAAYEAADRRQAPPARPVLFVGSSSFRMWKDLPQTFPGRPVLNRGFGGSTMEDLLHFKERLVQRYRPRLVAVYEGDNDLAQGQQPERVLERYREFLDWMQRELPGTPVVLVAVKPSPSRQKLLEAQNTLNAGLLRLATERPKVFYVDTFSPLLNTDGRPDRRWFLEDQLHLNRDGYGVWTPLLRGALDLADPQP